MDILQKAIVSGCGLYRKLLDFCRSQTMPEFTPQEDRQRAARMIRASQGLRELAEITKSEEISAQCRIQAGRYELLAGKHQARAAASRTPVY